MKKKAGVKKKTLKINVWIALGIAVLILAGIGLMIKQSGSDVGVPSGQNNGGTSTSSVGAKTYAVNLSGYAFKPKTLTISAGDSVIWTNRDPAFHDVTSDTNLFNSGVMTTGKTFKYTFKESGTYQYHCESHPYMKGVISVE